MRMDACKRVSSAGDSSYASAFADGSAPSLGAPRPRELLLTQSGGRTALTRALARGELTPCASTPLERAVSLFHLRARVAARYGPPDAGRTPRDADAHPPARDLALRVRFVDQWDLANSGQSHPSRARRRRQRGSAPGDQRRRHHAPATRTDRGDNATFIAVINTGVYVSSRICIHYVTSGPHAVDTADGGRRRHNPRLRRRRAERLPERRLGAGGDGDSATARRSRTSLRTTMARRALMRPEASSTSTSPTSAMRASTGIAPTDDPPLRRRLATAVTSFWSIGRCRRQLALPEHRTVR